MLICDLGVNLIEKERENENKTDCISLRPKQTHTFSFQLEQIN